MSDNKDTATGGLPLWELLKSSPQAFCVKTLPDGCLAISYHDNDASSLPMGVVAIWKGTPAAARALLRALTDALDKGAEVDVSAHAELAVRFARLSGDNP